MADSHEKPADQRSKRGFLTVIKYLFIAVVGLVAMVLVAASFQGDDFRVTRSATMAAPPAAVFAEVNDFHRWKAWSPWAKMDPKAKNSFEGADSGEGAIFRWESEVVGKGDMTIIESKPDELIRINLHFISPIEGTDLAEFNFKPVGEGTEVTWTISGKKAFVAKVMCLFMSMDKMIGGDFEAGLADIKKIVEKKEPSETGVDKKEPDEAGGAK